MLDNILHSTHFYGYKYNNISLITNKYGLMRPTNIFNVKQERLPIKFDPILLQTRSPKHKAVRDKFLPRLDQRQLQCPIWDLWQVN